MQRVLKFLKSYYKLSNSKTFLSFSLKNLVRQKVGTRVYLREKFFLAILVLALIPLLIVSSLSYSDARKSLMGSIKNYNEVLVQSMVTAVEDTVLSYKSLLDSIGDNINFLGTTKEKKDFILKTKETYPYNIRFLAVLDESGKEIIRSDGNPLEDRSNRPEFYEIKEKDYYLAWSSFNPVVEMPTVIISVPLFPEDKFQGTLVSEIFLSDIWGKVITGYTSPNDNIYLLTREGKPVAEILATTEDFRSEDLRKIAEDFAAKTMTVIKEVNSGAGRMLVIAESLPLFHWELVVFRPLSEIYKPTSILGRKVAIVSFVTFIFIFVATIFFSKLIVDPIKKLHKGAEIIGKGNLDYKVNIRTGDEIEQLAKEFNRMAESLGQSKAALEEEKALLEVRVAARTRELQELAAGLDVQVKERTRELDERVAELERFQKLIVGRELKMVELKKEIEKLRQASRESGKQQ